MKISLSTALLLVACVALSVGMYSERIRSTKLQQRLAIERKQFNIQKEDFLRNRRELVTSALSLGNGLQSEIPEESDQGDDGGFMARDPMTKEEIAILDLITCVNASQDIPTIVEIVFPEDHQVVLPEVQQELNRKIKQLWELSGRKTLAEINEISSWDSVFAIRSPGQLKTIIDDFSESISE